MPASTVSEIECNQALGEISGDLWTLLFGRECSFPPEIFREVMMNLIRNPNINSHLLFRADIALNVPFSAEKFDPQSDISPRITHFRGFDLKTVIVRTMIPRNILLDKTLDQSCLYYELVQDSGEIESLVVYLPHTSSAAETPFYHPAVRGIGFLHKYNPTSKEGTVSIHYSFFDSEPRSAKLERTARHLLDVLHKHGEGSNGGYVKRVHHDVVLPQVPVQNTYARLKAKYGKGLCEKWVETTDPTKHVFEDLAIAAFLVELWAEMYEDKAFPGFVDIGCGNGLLVHILLEEGYQGWGFDARERKSWGVWGRKAQDNLKELILIPSMLQTSKTTSSIMDASTQDNDAHIEGETYSGVPICDGAFPKGTFIISNHADELTPWTPILANLSESPFIMIPCCSHALSGARFRAPPPKNPGSSNSAYASLVEWVSRIAKDAGWHVEKEMLRIPSTRNSALIGRRRVLPFEEVDINELIDTHGGAAGWEENSLKLIKKATTGH